METKYNNENVKKFIELLQEDKNLQQIINKRDTDDMLPVEHTLAFTVGFAAAKGIQINEREVENVLTITRTLVAENTDTLKNFPKGFENIKVGIINKINTMCQSCAAPAAFSNKAIYEKLRTILE